MSRPLWLVPASQQKLYEEMEIRGIECTICMENILPTLIRYAPCGHCFHEKCITIWRGRTNTCPQCRKALGVSQLRRINFIEGKNPNDRVNLDHLTDKARLLRGFTEEQARTIKLLESSKSKFSEKELNKELANLKEQINSSNYESVRKIVNASRQDETIPNNMESIRRYVLEQERKITANKAVEHENQRKKSEALELVLVNTRKLETTVTECEKKAQEQEKKIEKLKKKLMISQRSASTPKQTTSQVNEIISSPNEPIARRTRSRLRNK